VIFRFYYKIYSISILSITFLARPLYRERLKRIIASIDAFAVAHIHAHIYTRIYLQKWDSFREKKNKRVHRSAISI